MTLDEDFNALSIALSIFIVSKKVIIRVIKKEEEYVPLYNTYKEISQPKNDVNLNRYLVNT